MTPRTLLRLLPLLLAVPLAAAPALAEPRAAHSVRDDLPAEAQKAWDSAKAYYDAHQYDGAAVAFLRAYELSKNPRVLFNVGVCEKNLHHYARALMRFRQAWAEGAGKLSADETKAINEGITVLEGYTTTVEIAANEPGATVFIDDFEVGKTPLPGPVPIDPGEARIIRLHKDTFEDASQTVRVDQASKPKVSFTLVREGRKTKVSVEVRGPSHATITVDGKDVGEDRYTDELPAGLHTFEGRASGYLPLRESANVVYGEPLNLTLTLIPERHEALVRVAVQPAGATIEIDNKPMATTAWQGKLSTAVSHPLVVKLQGYQVHTTELLLADDQVRDVEVTLVPEKTPWIYWATGAVAVVAGGAVLSYFLFKPSDEGPVYGTFYVPPVNTHYRFR